MDDNKIKNRMLGLLESSTKLQQEITGNECCNGSSRIRH